jgi:Ca2+-binding RTX toxin-like protein
MTENNLIGATQDTTINNPGKIGIGTWDKDALGSALNDVNQISFGWYYNWQERPLWDNDTTPESAAYIPMIWDETDMSAAGTLPTSTSTLLGFNEPDNAQQANMTVEQALTLWPQLMSTGKRLGSPATTMDQTLGSDSWLGRFMSQADSKGYTVDFVAVHYYPTNRDISAFKAFLEAAYAQYKRPIWVTEWALADWNNPGRFSAQEQADFAKAAIQMMDDLPFVERHAWFASYSGGDGWYLNTEIWNSDGSLSPVGKVFADLLKAPPTSAPDPVTEVVNGTDGIDVLSGTDRAETINGFGGDDRVDGNAGNDTINGGTGHDTLSGGTGADSISGGDGNDTYFLDDELDRATETATGGLDAVNTSVGYALPSFFENLTATGTDSINLTGNALNNQIVGNAGANVISGGSGNDIMDGGTGKDTLYGNLGKDIFVLNRILNSGNVDKFTDFSSTDDAIWLDNAVFTKLGSVGSASSPAKLNANYFRPADKAKDGDDYLIYNAKSGYLYYDADGSGAGKAVLVATLPKYLALTDWHFYVV